MSYVGPSSRDEQILKAILGEGIVDFEPQSRIEALLYRIYEEGGVGGGGAKLKGYYDTVAELEAAHPTGEAGDAYLVGNPSHIYTWLVDDQEWHDSGAFTAVPGPEGVGIVSIEKTSTAGLVDTYTVTYTDGDTDTFTVTNGAEGVGIVSIEKTATVGLVDTYTITLSDGNTYDFTVTNGSGGSGVPEGGTTGQVLAKKSDADGDVEWIDQSGGSDVSSEIESLSAATSELASETTVLASENSTRTSEINSLSTENSTQSSEISSLSESMSELASTVSSESTAQSEVDSLQNSSLASLSTENSTQTSEISSLSTASSEMASQVAELGSEVAEKQPMLTEGTGIDIDQDNVISLDANIYADAPLGVIMPYGGTTVPTAWLECDGSAVSRTTYADLFAVIGTKFGPGDGSTTFNLPSGDFGAQLYPAFEGMYIIKAVKTALPTDFEEALEVKQNITDNTLKTTAKTIAGAINELRSIMIPTSLESASWSKIKSTIQDGTFSMYAHVGDTKTFEMNGKTYHAEVVSINDGTGDAASWYPDRTVDFICTELYETTYQYNSTNDNTGGFPSSALRGTLINTLYPLLPSDLKDVIVAKSHSYITSTGGAMGTDSTKLWLPTHYEIAGATDQYAPGETASNNKAYTLASKIKNLNGQSSAYYWWLGSLYSGSATYFWLVTITGNLSGYNANYTYGVPVCFRIG